MAPSARTPSDAGRKPDGTTWDSRDGSTGTPPVRVKGAPAGTAVGAPGRRTDGTATGSGTRVPSGTRHRRPGGSPAHPGAAPVGAPADHGRQAGGTPPEVPRRAEGGAVSARPGGVLRGVPQPRPTDRFAEMLVAVLSGQRPVHAMLRHSAGQAYDELIRLAERGPLRTRGARPVVRDIGWFVPREGAIEAFARIGAGDRLRAMAFRLERGRDLRWRCTAVELGGPR
ncbi:Rv3235 family protein [Streptomyces griseorubens]